MEHIDVLFFSIEDWANVGYGFAESLKSVGINAHAFTMNEHVLGYEKQAEEYTSFVEMKKIVDVSDCIVFMHSDPTFVKLPFDINGKKKVVFHGGTTYRNNSKAVNNIFNGIVDISLVQTGDLLNLGAKNEKWIFPAIDTDAIKPSKTLSDKIVVGHYPRGPEIKGTEVILDVIEKLKKDFEFEFEYDPNNINHKENLNRINRCDIYIEAVKPELGGFKYGEWGVTALEAACMGKVVVSHFLSKNKYEEEFGVCPILTANNKYDLETHLTSLLSSKNGVIEKHQNNIRNWVVNNHSYKPTGERLKKVLELDA